MSELANRAMERYADGDAAAFSELYDALAPRLHGYLVRQVQNEAAAGDLLQQTMLQMHRARGSFRRGAEVLPWAYAIARRLLVDLQRKHVREELHAEPPDRATDHLHGDGFVTAKELEKKYTAAIAALPEAQRVAYELVNQEGLSHAEAAAVLGWTISSVKLRVHRAYVALRAALGEDYQ
ncbi:MAG: RNA polymerase sigma factor [Myxococcaceae bacterium]